VHDGINVAGVLPASVQRALGPHWVRCSAERIEHLLHGPHWAVVIAVRAMAFDRLFSFRSVANFGAKGTWSTSGWFPVAEFVVWNSLPASCELNAVMTVAVVIAVCPMAFDRFFSFIPLSIYESSNLTSVLSLRVVR